ncbi:VTT domain-containing protein [Candidatus Micrarchaeota archaeon]|nr:VTT domain-containing protein [Candidatus Micrarchaeota archaeon]
MKLNREAVLQIIAVLIISGLILHFSDQILEFSELGYLGVFLISLLSSATIIIPAPGWAVVLSMGVILNPVIVAVLAGIGSGIGELTGYFAGNGIVKIVNSHKTYKKHEELIKKYDFFAIILLSFLPNPFFDIAGMVAGALRMNVLKFILSCSIGKMARYFILLYALTNLPF